MAWGHQWLLERVGLGQLELGIWGLIRKAQTIESDSNFSHVRVKARIISTGSTGLSDSLGTQLTSCHRCQIFMTSPPRESTGERTI